MLDLTAKAMISASNKKRPDYRKLLSWLSTTTTANRHEVAGTLKSGINLRLNCLKKQLPLAKKILDWAVRLAVSC